MALPSLLRRGATAQRASSLRGPTDRNRPLHQSGGRRRATEIAHLWWAEPAATWDSSPCAIVLPQEATARKAGTTARTRTDEVRDVLDWAAGAGDAGDNHFGDSPALPGAGQGRFWNQQHDDFVQVKIFGQNVTARPPDEDARMTARLRDGSMPQDRPPLNVNGEEFRLVEQWVADGCPDDPL